MKTGSLSVLQLEVTMATTRQRRVAKLIIENATLDTPLTGGEMLEKVRYGKISKQPSRVLKSEGVLEALEESGFTEENAKQVVSEIMLSKAVDPNARLRATDQVFKVQGTYAPEKSVNVNIEVSKEYREKSKQAISQFLDGNKANT